MKRRRRAKPRLHQVILDAAKEVRKKKVTFEKEASACLSQALGFEVTVKIKRKPATDGFTPAMKKAERQKPSDMNKLLAEQLGLNAVLNDDIEL